LLALKHSARGTFFEGKVIVEKVFAGQCRLIELGFRQSGPAGYSLRRVLIDQSGTVKGQLSRGEHKSL